MNLQQIDSPRQSRWQNAGLLSRFHIDTFLLLAILLVIGVGMLLLYSAGGQDLNLIFRQVIRVGMALTVMLAIAQINPDRMRDAAYGMYLVGLVLLLAVLLFGHEGKGAQRWLDLGVFKFQPSEIIKLAVPILIARFISERSLPPSAWRIIVALVLIALPTVMIAKQPDLGTSILIASSGLLVLFLAGIRWRIIIGFIALCASAAPVLWYFMHDYQRRRVLTFLNPENDPLGAGYHIIQSKIAIGSGGLFGQGWLQGRQSHLEFLPERSTDFIFAVIAEEFGLVGTGILIALFMIIAARGLYIASQAQTSFAGLLAGSISITFLVYVFVNIGMVTGLLPVVGVPLPLISYGGTSMVTLLAGFGILMSIHTHRRMMTP